MKSIFLFLIWNKIGFKIVEAEERIIPLIMKKNRFQIFLLFFLVSCFSLLFLLKHEKPSDVSNSNLPTTYPKIILNHGKFTSPSVPSLLIPKGAHHIPNLLYKQVGNKNLYLSLTLPHQTPSPLIVWIHGGGWESGTKEHALPYLMPFVQEGYSVASIQYRLTTESPFPAQVEDLQDALMFLKSHSLLYGIEQKQIFLWGSSAGGHLASLLGTMEGNEHIQGVISWMAPTDLSQIYHYPSKLSKQAVERLLGGKMDEKKDVIQKANPINYITSTSPPFIIFHGERDLVVPWQQSDILHQSLRKSEVESHFYLIEGAEHEYLFGEDTLRLIMSFLTEKTKE